MKTVFFGKWRMQTSCQMVKWILARVHHKPHSVNGRFQTNYFVCANTIQQNLNYFYLSFMRHARPRFCMAHFFPSHLMIWPNFVNYIYKLADKCVCLWLRCMCFKWIILFGPIYLIALNIFYVVNNDHHPIIKYHCVTIVNFNPQHQNDSRLMIITL